LQNTRLYIARWGGERGEEGIDEPRVSCLSAFLLRCLRLRQCVYHSLRSNQGLGFNSNHPTLSVGYGYSESRRVYRVVWCLSRIPAPHHHNVSSLDAPIARTTPCAPHPIPPPHRSVYAPSAPTTHRSVEPNGSRVQMSLSIHANWCVHHYAPL
jgi:hypothetical protein